MQTLNKLQIFQAERREEARELFLTTNMSRREIADEVGVSQSTISTWVSTFNWGHNEDGWPATARFDLPGMMASKADLARESNDARASLRSFNRRALLAI